MAKNGDDSNPGTKVKPFATINAALKYLNPGDTLYLRGGIYYEQVYCAVAGKPEAPITIRSYPGEVAVIDGSFPEFQEDPGSSWIPFKESTGEFVSTRIYKNIRDVVGRFGDSQVGLQTYWYLMDLRADNELWIPDDKTMVKPVYCGPGLWYDKQTGRIHCRLAHTKLQLPEKAGHKITRYQGETDPRRLPLSIAPFNSRPLFVDQAMYVRFQDLVIRGGGYVTVDLLFGIGIEFDNCTIYAGTYGIWAKNTGPLKMTSCGVYGMIPPWAFRTENSLFAGSPYICPPFLESSPGFEITASESTKRSGPRRHIARLPTHALLVTAGGYEFETFYYPFNHDWEISNCEFTDGHDGVYLSGRQIHFHHNWVDNVQDDAVYLSSPTPFVTDRLYIYQNLITTCIAAFGAHGRGGPGGDIYLYRNVVDMRRPVQFQRPSADKPEGKVIRGSLPFLVHGAGNILHMERLYFYHNTFLYPANSPKSAFAGATALMREENTPRRVFNNIFLFYGLGGKYPDPSLGKQAEKADLRLDGNLHWSLTARLEPPPDWLKPLREHKLSRLNEAAYPLGLASQCLAADPKMIRVSEAPQAVNDYRLRKDSPAIARGVVLPPEWPDHFRSKSNRPDIGALPFGSEPLKVGRHGRITAGQPGEPE
ncbi:MAG: hypothetical protein QME75_00525 [Deltaproteobacteria bacterium]|nr:hypothetical protein [Deltaproteobacteria bacterium]